MPPPTGTKPNPRPGWMRVDYHYKYGADSRAMHTTWVSYDPTEAEAADDTDLATIEAKVRNDWLTYYGPHLSNGLVLEQIRFVLFRASGELALPFTTASAGSQTSTAMPAQCAIVVNWDVHAFYRGGKPKIFLPGVVNAALNTISELAPAFSSSLEGDMNSQIAHVSTWTSAHLTSPPVQIAPSWSTHGAYRTTAIQRQVQRAWVQLRLCTQRRRLGATIN